ncbi:MAG: hypothetical protein ABR548_02755 [Actinomycetota bacterium]|nr:hypothetical protein [Actinomycetota bacterium]
MAIPQPAEEGWRCVQCCEEVDDDLTVHRFGLTFCADDCFQSWRMTDEGRWWREMVSNEFDSRGHPRGQTLH